MHYSSERARAVAGIPHTSMTAAIMTTQTIIHLAEGRMSVQISYFLTLDLLVWFRHKSPEVSFGSEGEKRNNYENKWGEKRCQACSSDPMGCPAVQTTWGAQPRTSDLSTKKRNHHSSPHFPWVPMSHPKSFPWLPIHKERCLKHS